MRRIDAYEPSAAEISAACREIRQEWSEKEWESRSTFNNAHWLPPGILNRCRIQPALRKIPDVN